jgi:hypothetical protein
LAHKSSSDHRHQPNTLERCAIVVLGLYLAGAGIRALAAGHWMYPNYLRTEVAAPVSLVIGIVLIVAGLTLRH